MSAPLAADQLIGRNAIDSDGEKIGKIGQVYLNDQSNEPEWLAVSTGLFGSKESFAPISGASLDGDHVRLAVSKQLVKDAPSIDEDGHLSDEETSALYQHYAGHLGSAGQANYGHADYTDRSVDTTVAGAGHDTSGPNTDDAMTRSEERLRVGTEHVETGRARLRKYIVEENVTTTVPVSHEEVRIEREPITDANVGAATSGTDISEEEHEVVLHAEKPVVAKETVPVERVRMGTQTVTEQQTVSDEVRKEQIEVEGDDRTR